MLERICSGGVRFWQVCAFDRCVDVERESESFYTASLSYRQDCAQNRRGFHGEETLMVLRGGGSIKQSMAKECPFMLACFPPLQLPLKGRESTRIVLNMLFYSKRSGKV